MNARTFAHENDKERSSMGSSIARKFTPPMVRVCYLHQRRTFFLLNHKHIFNMSRKIDNPSMPLSIFVGQIFTDSEKKDKGLIALHEQANDAIKIFKDAKATAENCQQLRHYLEIILVDVLNRPQSDAKDELYTAIMDRIETLKTGIELAEKHESYSKTLYQPKKDDKYKGWKSFSEQYQKAVEQYKVNGYRNIPIVWDTTKLEGFIRSIPGIKGMDVFEFFKMYFYDQLLNFVKPTPEESKVVRNGGSSEKYIDRAAQICAKRFAFVQLTSVTRIVIENRYPEADEMFTIMEEN